MDQLTHIPAFKIAQMVRDGEISAVDVTTAHLGRIEEINPKINAIVDHSDAEALKAARDIDARIARGEDPGPLAGVPVTIKVNVDQKGSATTNGLRLQRDLIAKADSPVTANLRKAGAIIVGRTNTPAFSIRWFTNNSLHGQTLNPHNPDLTPGGSSGGAASAVAAGLCAIGHGTDIAGSVRYPAYACGIHGLRPSHGRIPVRNATGPDRMIGAQLMAVSGPIARSIEDVRLALAAMSAPDPQDPWHVSAPLSAAPFEKRAALSLAPDGMKVDAPIQEALRKAAKALEAAGWTIEETACPPIRQAADINATLWIAETQLSADLITQEDDPDSKFAYEAMLKLAGPTDLNAVMTALQTRTDLMRQWALFFERYPIVICPVSGELPFTQQSDVRSEADFERIYEAQLTQRGLPVMGMPALAVATGIHDTQPLGVQLVSARFREDILLEAGRVIEDASPPIKIATP